MTEKDAFHGRCPWPGHDPLYVAYHDEEWGVPEWESRALFEKLVLDGFQAGLAWITILRKREAFRKAFDGFEPAKIARYKDAKVEALLADSGIVRHRGKIEGAIAGAKAYLAIEREGGFASYLWSYTGGKPIQNALASMKEAPAETPLSREISKDLKSRGFKFCGPTIVYAFMQAVGIVNDHLITCPRHKAVARMGKAAPLRRQA